MLAKWYIINVYSGYEKKVVESIKEQANIKGMSEKFEEIIFPTEKVIEIRKGAKVSLEKKCFPGYVLIKMEMTDDTWHLIKNTGKVNGFLGGKKPSPISEFEVKRILDRVEECAEKPKSTIFYEIGEHVRVCDGPFNSFSGVIEEVDEGRSRLKVSVSIFGRSTPVELEYVQVEKV